MQIGRLLVHTLSPALPLADRKEALELVFDARHLDILKESLSPSLEVMPDPTLASYSLLLCVFRATGSWCRFLSPSHRVLFQHGPKLSLYLHEMLHDHKEGLTKEEQNAVGVFMTSLKLCGHRCIPPNAAHKQDLLKAIKEVPFQ